MTRVILVRHGQTAWNEGAGEERFRGHTDLALDDIGHAQARAVAGRLQHQEIAALYTSPLLRGRQTIAPLAEFLGLPAHPHAGLIDIDYGRFQGMTHSEASAAYPEIYALWRTRPSQVCFPDGESLSDLRLRLLHLLDEIVERHSGQTVVLLGHQIVNKVMACILLGLDLDQIWRIQQDTCGIDLFAHVKGAWQILTLNDTCHLEALVLGG